MPDRPSENVAATVEAWFARREELPLEARVPIVEAMGLLRGPEAGVVATELDGLLGREDDSPRSASLLARLSLFGARSGELPSSTALGLAAAAARRFPDEVEPATRLILARAEAGQDREALDLLLRIAEGNPSWAADPQVSGWEGALRYNLGQLAEAAEAYGRAAAEDCAPLYLLRRGDAFRRLGRADEALRCYRAALRRAPDFEEALLGYLTLAPERERPSPVGWIRGAAERLLTKGRVRLTARDRLALGALRAAPSRSALRRLLLRAHRRHPEQLDPRLALGFVALLDLELDWAEELLAPLASSPRPDYVGLGLATAAAVYAGRTEEAAERAMHIRLLRRTAPVDAHGVSVDDRFLSSCLQWLHAWQPRLADPHELEGYEAVLWDWPVEAPALPLPTWLEKPAMRVQVELPERLEGLAAASAYRVGELPEHEIELVVVGDGERAARIGVYGGAESLSVRWLAGHPLTLYGRRLGTAYVRVAVEEPEGTPWAHDERTLRRGADLRRALEQVLGWG